MNLCIQYSSPCHDFAKVRKLAPTHLRIGVEWEGGGRFCTGCINHPLPPHPPHQFKLSRQILTKTFLRWYILIYRPILQIVRNLPRLRQLSTQYIELLSLVSRLLSLVFRSPLSSLISLLLSLVSRLLSPVSRLLLPSLISRL